MVWEWLSRAEFMENIQNKSLSQNQHIKNIVKEKLITRHFQSMESHATTSQNSFIVEIHNLQESSKVNYIIEW